MMRARRLLCAVLTALVLVAAACGGDDDGGGSQGGGGESQDGGGGGGSGGNGGGDGSEDEGFVVNTELDLGQAFAEPPMFDGTLGPVAVAVLADRGGGSNAQVPITFGLTNAGEDNLKGASFTIRFTILPGEDPEDPPMPGPDDPPLELAPQTTAGSCAATETTSSGATIACALGTLASGAVATVTVTSPQWFRFSIGMELTAAAS
jgi:hypothetical protein